MGNEELEQSRDSENKDPNQSSRLPTLNSNVTEKVGHSQSTEPIFSTDETKEKFLNNTTNISTLLYKSTKLAYLVCMLCSFGGLSAKIFAKSDISLTSMFFSPSYFFYFALLCFWNYSFATLTHELIKLRTSLFLSLVVSLILFSLYLITSLITLLLTWTTSMGYTTLFSWIPGALLTTEASLFDIVLVLSSPFFLLLLCFLTALDNSKKNLSTLLSGELKKVSEVISKDSLHKAQFARTLAIEFEEATSMVVQTVKQLSPGELLLKPQEHVSACSIPIPTASVTAIYSSLCHIISLSSHLDVVNQLFLNDGQIAKSFHAIVAKKAEFEIGDLIQSVGDILAGAAAEANIELVLCHGDGGLHQMRVLGNEEAFRHILITTVKNVIASTKVLTAIELGLHFVLNSENEQTSKVDLTQPRIHQCTIEVLHTPKESSKDSTFELYSNDLFTRRLIKELGGEIRIENKENSQMISLLFKLPIIRSKPDDSKKAVRDLGDTRRRLKISDEPSAKELASFSNTLRGLKVALHAKNHSTFAKHLTSCLTIWGTDITHISIDAPCLPQNLLTIKGLHVPHDGTRIVNGKLQDGLGLSSSGTNNDVAEDVSKFDVPPSFIIIDDDVKTLRDQFISLRNNPAFNFSNHQHRRHKRMELLSNHLITSIIHFTSLSNYQQIKDEVYSLLMMPHHLLPPQVLVIPKPVGPMRLLTALYTAVMKPKVDPSYVPIATSPMSPGLRYHHTKEEEKNPMDMINFDTYRPPTDSSMDSIAVPTPNNGTATPIAGTIVFDPKQYASNGQKPVVSALSRVTPYLNRKTSDQNTSKNTQTSISGANARPSLGSPMINGKPIALPPTVISRSKGSPGASPVISSPVSHIAPLPTPLSAPLPATIPLPLPTPAVPKTKSKGSQKKKTTRPSSGTSKSTSALSNVVSPPINVLIVEDNPINQTILSTFMRKRKIKYSVANNGLEAVEKWKEGGFHLVLMDIQLPVMDGIEATKKIRSIEKMQKIGVLGGSSFNSNGDTNPTSPTSPFCSPVIILALTASSLQSDRHAALAAGCNDFLTKPVSLVWLEKKIMEWGCMQALIDFEGWRKWKSQDSSSSPNGSLSKVFTALNRGKETSFGSRESLIPSRNKSGINKKSSQEMFKNLTLPTQKAHKKSNNESNEGVAPEQRLTDEKKKPTPENIPAITTVNNAMAIAVNSPDSTKEHKESTFASQSPSKKTN